MKAPEADIQQTINDPRLQLAIYTATGRVMDLRAKVVSDEALPDYQALRKEANAIKKHTIENLDYYLEQLESNVVAHGGKVIYCRTGQEAADFVLDLAKKRGVHMLVKSKSMTSEEIHFNERLEEHQLEAVETDLGEYILQLAHQRPYHIVAPALHLTRFDVADIFTKELGIENEEVIEKQTKIAREVLRQKFLRGGHRRQRREFPGRRFGRRGHRGERRQRAPQHLRAQDSHRYRRDRKGDSARPGSRGFPESAGPQRHRPAAHGLHVFSFRTTPRRAKSMVPTNSTCCCWTTAAPSCWLIRKNASRSIASVAARA